MSKDGFKRAFQKLLGSSEKNFEIRKGKVLAALRDLEGAVRHLEENESPEAETHRDHLDRLRRQVSTSEAQAKRDAKGAFAGLDAVKDEARTRAKAARAAAKKAPMQLSLGGGEKATVFSPDIPGFDKLSEQERAAVTKKVAGKIASGKALLDMILNAPNIDEVAPPSRKEVTDLMWLMKSKAQEKLGAPYERGAMTIPDPGNKLRAYLDRCSEVYGRDSSHLNEQQKGKGGQGRGIDLYEGVSEEHEIEDFDSLLPNGMRTMLYQQVTMASGEQRLYLKMETESARFNPKFSRAEETPEARPLHAADVGRSILHLGNLIKSKLGMSQGEDKDLASYREKTAKDVVTAYEAAISAAKKSNKEAYNILKGAKGRVHQILANVDALNAAQIPLDADTVKAIYACYEAIMDLYGQDDLDARFGGEVVLGMDDIGGKVVPTIQNDPKEIGKWMVKNGIGGDLARAFETALKKMVTNAEPTIREDMLEAVKLSVVGIEVQDALGILNTQVAAVERCQHTDELLDLKKVQAAALKAIHDVRGARQSREDPAVLSTIRHLEDKLAPLGRLIASMEAEEALA